MELEHIAVLRQHCRVTTRGERERVKEGEGKIEIDESCSTLLLSVALCSGGC